MEGIAAASIPGLMQNAGIVYASPEIHAAFAFRVREVGMLQAMGYTRRAIVLNPTEESVFASASGALIDGMAVRFSMGAFALTIDAYVVLTGLAGGLLVGCGEESAQISQANDSAIVKPAWLLVDEPVSASDRCWNPVGNGIADTTAMVVV